MKYRRLKPRFWLSTVAAVFGAITFITGFVRLNSLHGGGDLLNVGACTLLGTVAYRSLKRTRLNLKRPSARRRVLEILAFVCSAAIVLFQNHLADRLYADPIMVIPLIWSLAAYVLVYFQPQQSSTRPQD
jgi:drug/metabolite transporter (DMT)-like permease